MAFKTIPKSLAWAFAATSLCMGARGAYAVSSGSQYGGPPLPPAIDPYHPVPRLGSIEEEFLEPEWIREPYDSKRLEANLAAVRRARFSECKHSQDPSREYLFTDSVYMPYMNIRDVLISYERSSLPRRAFRYNFEPPVPGAGFRQLEIEFVANRLDIVVSSVRMNRGVWRVEGDGFGTLRYKRMIEASDVCAAELRPRVQSVIPRGALVPDDTVSSGPIIQRPRTTPRPFVPMAY